MLLPRPSCSPFQALFLRGVAVVNWRNRSKAFEGPHRPLGHLVLIEVVQKEVYVLPAPDRSMAFVAPTLLVVSLAYHSAVTEQTGIAPAQGTWTAAAAVEAEVRAEVEEHLFHG